MSEVVMSSIFRETPLIVDHRSENWIETILKSLDCKQNVTSLKQKLGKLHSFVLKSDG